MAMADAPLMLSVSGLRGVIGESLTPTVAAKYAAALGSWFIERRPAKQGSPVHVVVGRDSRPSGAMIEMAAVAGLMAAGCRVTTLGICTTPGVGVMVQHHKADGGVVITASHNPIIWNGIKALGSDAAAPPAEHARRIVERFQQDDISYAGVLQLQRVTHDDSVDLIHTRAVLNQIDVDAIRARRFKVVLDSVHGAGGPSTARLLRELGVELIHLHGEPSGLFPHPPEPTRENLVGLCEAVRAHGADLGLAQDPDADRLALVDEHGSYIGEEYTLALCAWHVLQTRAGSNATVAANLSTSRMLDDVAAMTGASVLRSAVGEANVVARMRAADAIIGGEGNGGVIWPAVVHVRDSLGSAALILEMLAQRRRSLSQLVAAIPRYAMIKDKVDLKPGSGQGLADRLRSHFTQQKLDTQDGIRIDWPDRWVHIRPSNTEPIIRVIAEARDDGQARELINLVKEKAGL